MPSSSGPVVEIPVFAGHGTSAANSPFTRQQALQDATSSHGEFLLASCFDAFWQELSSLSSEDRAMAGIDLSDFQDKQLLLTLPSTQYKHNSILSGISLFLMQALRYLAFVDAWKESTLSFTPFIDLLRLNGDHKIGVFGFSSGVLTACVVAASSSTVAYVSTAVEVFKLALWIGVRTQLYKVEEGSQHFTIPWSLVFLGLSKENALQAIGEFSQTRSDGSLYVTAIMDDCVTISGRPDVLEEFTKSSLPGVLSHYTAVDTLYHSSVHRDLAKAQILEDVQRRSVKFPDFIALTAPVRSTVTGTAVSSKDGSLVSQVVDMLLIEPVNWDKVVRDLGVSFSTLPDLKCRLINIGPGSALIRSLERAFAQDQVFVHDLTTDTDLPSLPSGPIAVKQEPIAIVGMAVHMPGARNASQLWNLLERGLNTISEVPSHRFNVEEYCGPGSKPGRRMKARSGNFIEGLDEFDHVFFKISPREAKQMDPQMRLLLHTSYHALEHSGYVPDSTPSSKADRFGCFIGAATSDYSQNLRDDIDAHYATGTLRAFMSGRISYAMQLSGPSVVVDTACSSSLVAVYQASRALMNRDCDSALVGGVNVISSPDMFLGLDRGHFLSPTGQCKAFDASADGYARSEGCGMFVLKRLSDARTDNDNIMAIVRAVEINQSGHAQSITHPHAPTQASLFKQIFERARIDPRRVNVVEAHGTGTKAGDPAEMESVRSVLSRDRSSANPLYITAIKSNIGHLEAASGAAGLAKLLLMFKNGAIPATVSLKHLNPRIPCLETDHTIVNTKLLPWYPSHDGQTRMALLNNFGAAGSNAAVLLEEFTPPPRSILPFQSCSSFVFGLSAKTATAADQLRCCYLAWLSSDHCTEDLADLAYTMTARRQVYPYRHCVTASSREELVEKLGKSSACQVTPSAGKIVFVFSGQGSQFLGMGSELYATCPLFRDRIDECDSLLTSGGFPSILPVILSPSCGSSLSDLQAYESFQPAVLALEYALAKLWISWGVTPSAVVGHSLGEYAALVMANVISLRSALNIVARRARLMIQRCPLMSTGMMAVNLPPSKIHEVLAEHQEFASLNIACYNGPSDCVISGSLDLLHRLRDHLNSQFSCRSHVLDVPFGYHSSAMEPIASDLALIAQKVTIRAPDIPIVSNVLGKVVLPFTISSFDSSYFSRHCIGSVHFEQGVESLMSLPDFRTVHALIEIGPHPSCLPMMRANRCVPKECPLLASMRKDHNPWQTLVAALSQLYMAPLEIQWRQVFSHLPSVHCIDLPPYPFARIPFYEPYKENSVSKADGRPSIEVSSQLSLHIDEYDALDRWRQYPNPANNRVAIFETDIFSIYHLIEGHIVCGMALCPGSVYLELALAGIELAKHRIGKDWDENAHVILRKVLFAKPLVYAEGVERKVITTITFKGSSGSFQISSRGGGCDDSIHVNGQFLFKSTFETLSKFTRALPTVTRQMEVTVEPRRGQEPETFSTRTAYEVIFPRIVAYGTEYQTMQTIVIAVGGMEGFAEVRFPTTTTGKFVAHPYHLDSLLHVAGFVANMRGTNNDAYVCCELDTFRVFPSMIASSDSSYAIHCSNSWVADDKVMYSEVFCIQKLGDKRRVVAHLKGLAFRRLRLDSLKKSLSLAAHPPQDQAVPDYPLSPISPRFTRSHSSRSTPRFQLHDTEDDTLATVLRIVTEACGVGLDTLDIDAELASIGVDSLMTIEIIMKLEATFTGLNLNSRLLASCTTIGDLAHELSSMKGDYDSADACEVSSDSTVVADNTLWLTQTPRTLETPQRILPQSPHFYRPRFVTGRRLTFGGPLSDVSSQLNLPSFSPVKSTTCSANFLGLEENPVEIQTLSSSNVSAAPLFILHDGSGLVDYCNRLENLQRQVYGIFNPRIMTVQQWDSIEEMAIVYADYIRGITREPVVLCGWSFGAVLAYEITRQLLLRGPRPRGILLIDPPSPFDKTPLSESLINAIVNVDPIGSHSEARHLVRKQFETSTRLLTEYAARDAPSFPCPPIVLLRSSESYCPPGISGIPRWLSDRRCYHPVVSDWETKSGSSIRLFNIPGHHFEPFHPINIHELSVKIKEACNHLDRS